MIRCPNCGAKNPESAAWCLQCFTPSLRSDPAAASTLPSVADDPGPTAPDADPAAAPDRAGRRVDGVDTSRIRTGEEGVEWRCARCTNWNALDHATCVVCGATFDPTPAEPPVAATVSPAAALTAAAVLPGAGHWLLGRRAGAVSRAVLYVVWLIGGVALWREAAGAGQSVLPALPPLVGAAALWAGTLVDTRMALAGRGADRDVLGPRTLMWVVVGVVGGVLLAFVVTAARLA